MKISVIIPTLGRRELLEENLPPIIDIVKKRNDTEVVVAIDGETTTEWIERKWPEVRVISRGKRCGFSSICNYAARNVEGEYLLFLNDDIRATVDFISPLYGHFRDKYIFAVGAGEVEVRDEIPVVDFKFGLFLYLYEIPHEDFSSAIPVLFVSAGHAMFDRAKFLELGGFDEHYSPFYWEDLDICIRAWQRGWKVIYEPRSRVNHVRQSTIARLYSPGKIASIHWSHRFMFMRKILDKRMLIHHYIWLPFVIIWAFVCRRKEIATGYVRSVCRGIPSLDKKEKREIIRIIKMFHRGYWKRKYKVLYLHETSRISGAEMSLINLLRFLKRDIFSPLFVLPQEGALSQRLTSMDIPFKIIQMPRIRSVNISGILKSVINLVRFIGQEDIDIIHSQSIRTHIYGAIAGKIKGISLVWHERNLITTEYMDPDRVLGFIPDIIICNSMAIARRFSKKGILPEKVKVVYNGVDLDLFNPSIDGGDIRRRFGISRDVIVVGIASRFSQDKGHDTFLQVARMIVDRYKDGIYFLIAGGAVFEEDAYREAKLRKMSVDMGLEERVIFTGPRTDMPRVYAAMDIVVLASYAEPCGRVLFEAMSMGKPLVATDTGGTPEIVVDGVTGILVPPHSPVHMADAIMKLIKDRDYARKIGNAGRRRVEEHFNIIKNVRQIEAIYEKVMV